MVRTELHVTSDDLIVVRFLDFYVEQSVNVKSVTADITAALHSHLVSPFDTKPMLSSGSCLTGLSLSHGVEDLRVKGTGNWPAMLK